MTTLEHNNAIPEYIVPEKKRPRRHLLQMSNGNLKEFGRKVHLVTRQRSDPWP